MKYLASFLALCATALCATQYEAPAVAPGSITPPNHISPLSKFTTPTPNCKYLLSS